MFEKRWGEVYVRDGRWFEFTSRSILIIRIRLWIAKYFGYLDREYGEYHPPNSIVKLKRY